MQARNDSFEANISITFQSSNDPPVPGYEATKRGNLGRGPTLHCADKPHWPPDGLSLAWGGGGARRIRDIGLRCSQLYETARNNTPQ